MREPPPPLAEGEEAPLSLAKPQLIDWCARHGVPYVEAFSLLLATTVCHRTTFSHPRRAWIVRAVDGRDHVVSYYDHDQEKVVSRTVLAEVALPVGWIGRDPAEAAPR